MTREQALAVITTGLAALAMNGQLNYKNDPSGRLVLAIANAKIVLVPTPESGKVRMKIVSANSEAKTANTANAGSANT
jgi:hypothetical protein